MGEAHVHALPIAAQSTWESLLHEGLEGLQLALLISPRFGQQGVATAKLALQVLGAAQALELPVHHDGQPRAQRLALLHAVGREGIAQRGGGSRTPSSDRPALGPGTAGTLTCGR